MPPAERHLRTKRALELEWDTFVKNIPEGLKMASNVNRKITIEWRRLKRDMDVRSQRV